MRRRVCFLIPHIWEKKRGSLAMEGEGQEAAWEKRGPRERPAGGRRFELGPAVCWVEPRRQALEVPTQGGGRGIRKLYPQGQGFAGPVTPSEAPGADTCLDSQLLQLPGPSEKEK